MAIAAAPGALPRSGACGVKPAPSMPAGTSTLISGKGGLVVYGRIGLNRGVRGVENGAVGRRQVRPLRTASNGERCLNGQRQGAQLGVVLVVVAQERGRAHADGPHVRSVGLRRRGQLDRFRSYRDG